MENAQFVEKVRMALQLAREEVWDHPIPKTPIRLNMLLRLLSNCYPGYWNEDAENLVDGLLTGDRELALKLNEFDPLTLAFAKRAHRFVERSLDKNPSPKPDHRARKRK